MAKIIFVSGKGTSADASDTNGGAYEGSVTWDQIQGTNGGPIDTCTGGTITDSGGSIRITSVGNFSNTLVDMYVYCDFSATYTDGSYKVTAVDASDNYIDIDLAWSTDVPTSDCNVGGAVDTIAEATTNRVEAGDTIKITDAVTYTSADDTSIVNCSHVAATSVAIPIVIEGVNASDGVMEEANKVEIDCGDSIANGVLPAWFYVISNFEIHSATGNGVTGTGGRDQFMIKYCKIHDCGGIGVNGDDYCFVYKNEIYSNDSHGIQLDNGASILYNTVYNNGGIGIDCDGGHTIAFNKIYNNTNYEIQMNYGSIYNNVVSNDLRDVGLIYVDEQNWQQTNIINNTLYGADRAGTTGIILGSVVAPIIPYFILNNIISNCGTGIDAYIDLTQFSITDSNLFYSNDTDATNWNTGRNVQTGTPDFTDAANEDFSLGSSSNAIDNGIGQTS